MRQLFAEVAVNSTFPHRQTFSYSVPDGLDVRPGSGVYVPFGRVTLQGIVLDVHDTPVFSEPEKIRPIRSVIGERPLIDDERVALARSIAEYYVAPVFDAVSLMLPPGFERRPVTVVRALVDADEIEGLELSLRQRELLAAAAARSGIDMESVRTRVSFKAVEPVAAQLERRGLLVREYTLARPRIGPKTIEVASLALEADEARHVVKSAEAPKASRRAALLERLVEKRRVSDEEGLRLAGSRANLDRLVRAGSVRPDREGHRIELGVSTEEALREAGAMRLTKRAAQALHAISVLEEDVARSLPSLRVIGVESATVRWMTDIGALHMEERAVERDPLDARVEELLPPARLLPAQAEAASRIGASIDASSFGAFLLHGVTGSGKTEVYLDALDRAIVARKRAIVLVPEIALTPQTVRRFRERFERVAVLHSGLSDGERFDQWHGIAEGRYDVVIGPRSALFAPLPDLGLIVVDEEHEWTYKQHEPAPRYHARDTAIELARRKRATIVLGSATPDVESYERAERGELQLLTLPERVRPVAGNGRPATLETTASMPQITVVDLREELHAGNRSMFSTELRGAVVDALAADEQVILFLNRRGMAGHVQCRDCGSVPECASCFVALTYHSQYDRLVCHQCNRQSRLPAACKQCGSPRVRLMGAGVEKVEAEASRAFPQARLLRWDRDATRGLRSHERILKAFLAHDADILIGTQMLAKGLDLPDVTVVGVMNADVGLHLPDFRAGERTFQLLTQVAGRAGRGERPGRVILQTYQPDHYAVDAAARYDYDGFVAAELRSRQRAGYPPFARLVRLTFAGTSPKATREDAMRVQRALTVRRAEIGSDVEVLGPAPAYVPKIRGRWRWHVMLRGRDPASLVRDFVLPPTCVIDVDPVGIT